MATNQDVKFHDASSPIMGGTRMEGNKGGVTGSGESSKTGHEGKVEAMGKASAEIGAETAANESDKKTDD